MPKPVLQIVIASTRPGRVGLPVARWFDGFARRQGSFTVELVDLAEVALRCSTSPGIPSAVSTSTTTPWPGAHGGAGDAFVFVHPEYNHSYNAALKNALDYLHHEWNYKPVGFVSYGGVAAGTRALTALKPVVAALRMTPVVEAVNIPFVAQFIDDQGDFVPNEVLELGAAGMLAELERVETALRTLRVPTLTARGPVARGGTLRQPGHGHPMAGRAEERRMRSTNDVACVTGVAPVAGGRPSPRPEA